MEVQVRKCVGVNLGVEEKVERRVSNVTKLKGHPVTPKESILICPDKPQLWLAMCIFG